MKICYYSIKARIMIEGLTYNITREFSPYDKYELLLIFSALTNHNIFHDTYVSFYDKNKNCIIRFYRRFDGYCLFKCFTGKEQYFDELDYKQFSAIVQQYL